MTASAFSVLAFSGAQWILLIVFIIPVLILWGYAIVSLIGRHDLGIGAKLLWLVGILIAPDHRLDPLLHAEAGAAGAEPPGAGPPQALSAATHGALRQIPARGPALRS